LMMRLRELEAKQAELTERLSRAPMDIPDIHPNVAGIYRRKVERLAEALKAPTYTLEELKAENLYLTVRQEQQTLEDRR
ncbi:MAG TPA: hypothetical protein PLV53_02270, partial [Anaerolineaceae bacterium]|nr:hypothetical protein [Anaerolineaceae bacterium]